MKRVLTELLGNCRCSLLLGSVVPRFSCGSRAREIRYSIVEATTRDVFALIDSFEITVERPLVVDSLTCVKKREPKYHCHGGRLAALLRLASLREPLVLIGVANVDSSAISVNMCTLRLR